VLLDAPPLLSPHLLQFEYSQQLWPWSGFLAVYLRVKEEGAAFAGLAHGEFKFVVRSPPARGETQPRRSIVHVAVTAEIIPTPPRRVGVCRGVFRG
jgi:membrane-bound transcription factor site-1 protease